jgi:hypothetical protein
MMGEDTNPKNDSVLRRLKDRAEGLQAGVSEKLDAVSGSGMEEFKERIAELNEMIPLISELGYSVEDIRLGIGLLPEVGISISGLTKTMPDEAYNRIIVEQKEKPLLIGTIKALQNASAMQHRIHIMGMRADTASITLGFPPKIMLEFKKA